MSFVRALQAAVLIALISNTAAKADDKYGNVHSVGVIYALSDAVIMSTYGITPWSINHYKFQADWNANAQITDQIDKALSSRFEVKKLSIDANALPNINQLHRMADYIVEWDDVVEQFVKTLPASNGVDAYVIVLPEQNMAHRVVFGDDAGPHGSRDAGVFSPHIIFGAAYFIGVYDAMTGKRIGYAPGSPAAEQCPVEMWAENQSALTPEQRDRIQREILALLSRSVPSTLADAKLIGDDAAKTSAAQISLPTDPACHRPDAIW